MSALRGNNCVKRFLSFLLLALAPLAKSQSITQQPTSQTVQVGQTATFTVTVSGGPCRSYWLVNGKGVYGAIASTISFQIPNVTVSQNGTTVQAEMYGCAGGSAVPISNVVTLTVGGAPPPPSISVSPSTASIQASPTIALTSTVTNGTSGVNWSASCGTVDANGNYTPPSIVPSGGICTVTAALQSNPSTTASAAITVTPLPVITLNGTSVLPPGAIGIPYSQNLLTVLGVAGGTPPYTFAVTSGTIQPGLTLSPSGLLSGTPTGSGSAAFSITITDSSGVNLRIVKAKRN